MNPALAMPSDAEWRESIAARFAALVPLDAQLERVTAGTLDDLAATAPNSQCRSCRRPSHSGGCLDPPDRPGALRPVQAAPESDDHGGNPHACPALAYGPACPPCARRLAVEARRDGYNR